MLFVGKFLLVYFVGNLIYGFFVESYGSVCDPITINVSRQTAWLLEAAGFQADVVVNPTQPTVFLKGYARVIVNIFEGCNGINVMIVFVAFIVAFPGRYPAYLWFIPAGLLIIHIMNLLRIFFLYYASLNVSEYFYYFHKYIFTSILYCIVFALWFVWVIKFNDAKLEKPAP